MKIVLVQNHKIKTSLYKVAAIDYEKRLTRFAKVYKDTKLSNKYIKDQNVVIFQVMHGEIGDNSNDMAMTMSEMMKNGTSTFVFLLSEEKKIENTKPFYLSTFSLSADIDAILIREQVYRFFKIMEGEPYHK